MLHSLRLSFTFKQNAIDDDFITAFLMHLNRW